MISLCCMSQYPQYLNRMLSVVRPYVGEAIIVHGESISRGLLQDGDLVFFGSAEDKINHVGIYVGNGRFVHAPRRGEDIRTSSIDESYFEKRFVGARRYFQ